MKGYYRIDKFGLFELWESEKYGDEVPAKVTFKGQIIGETYDSLENFLKVYLDL